MVANPEVTVVETEADDPLQVKGPRCRARSGMDPEVVKVGSDSAVGRVAETHPEELTALTPSGGLERP